MIRGLLLIKKNKFRINEASKMDSIWLPFAIILVTSLINKTNTLANCPISCHCNDVSLVVNCGEGSLDVLPIALNPSIQRLQIKNNKIKTIDSSIQFYADLNYLDLSHNHLFSIPPRTFSYQKMLQELHLNHNKVGTITNKTFIGLSSLIVLNLRDNFLDSLTKGVFSTLTNLEDLNIGQNRIKYIDADAFEGLKKLRVLFMDDNSMVSVPSPSFVHIPQLAELYLGVNRFSLIKSGAFESLRELNRLDIRSTLLDTIQVDVFKGIENIRALDISDNQLVRIPSVELSKLKRLEELYIGQNDFKTVAEKAFIGLKNLKKVDISGSIKLTTVESGAFLTNSNLETIMITSNKAFSELQEGAFSGLPYLKHLILRDNALVALTESLTHWNDLETLDLTDNPLTCDCRMAWFRDLLSTKNASHRQEHVLCAYPEKLRGQSLQRIPSDVLGCTQSVLHAQTNISVIVVGCVAFVTVIILLAIKCRRQIHDMFLGKWRSMPMSSKELEYQKTFYDDDFMFRHPHPCGLSSFSSMNHYSYVNPTIRTIPTTEL
ncbi:Leucine-rich repeats and immunoglobulin-like domains protein 2 [Pseudolycoriella hygida]|uniref:Leucine-rich repeats and immunoglobulin-like domains protein 2 n=1 Tax=Pseudolycoriella hygida TaxID=35572 RepID=A0A9Q0NDY0_9DIPT|nr:Leucine-rich repeats and immunoglobulin-like domains protein 2 [Pseudolycoriella hygida]